MAGSRRLLARMRDTLARGPAPLQDLVRLVASELVTEVCSIYVLRPGDLLELLATEGLNAAAVGQTRLRVGEGIIGLCAATGQVLNLPDAQNHPAFAYRPETGEEPYASLLAVPIRRAGRRLGVIAVQNRSARTYDDDEVDALETISLMLSDLLGRAGASDGAQEGVAATLPRIFSGTVLVRGIVVGAIVTRGQRAVQTRMLADDPETELRRLREASRAMRAGLDDLFAAQAPRDDGGATREVLEAYRLIASDTGWMRRVEDAVRGGLSAEAAVQRVSSELRDRMRRIADPYLRERLADLDDLAGRLLAALSGGASKMSVPPGAILVARRLGPAELLEWQARGIGGLAIEEASGTGHAAIIARALGLPALGGLRGLLDVTEDEDHAVLDADEGQLLLRPEFDVRDAYARAVSVRAVRRAGWAVRRTQPAVTADGTPMQLMLNAGLPMELDQLAATGADGIGLFRTEIAMLARGGIADLGEQTALYARVLDAAAGKPVLFRTLDLGGDKILPGTEIEEENPAMGWRSIRIGLDRPAILRKQLRALLLAANGGALSVMFPMITTLGEFRRARALLLAEADRVRPTPRTLRIGTMLEVPALLWQLPALLAEADFVSIGSNDLLQFVFAADRGAPALNDRYDILSAPALDLLEHAVRCGEAIGRPLSLCGEAASRPLEAMALAAIGFRTLSMSAPSLPSVKDMLCAVDLAAFRPVLAALRRGGVDGASLRDPIAAWAREQGVPL